MSRPKKLRWISGQPGITYFKPQGVPLRILSQVCLEVDELEALKLADLEGLSQKEAADQMNVSRATFGRIVAQARHKVADALVKGRAIRIEGGEVTLHPNFIPGQGYRYHGKGRRHGW